MTRLVALLGLAFFGAERLAAQERPAAGHPRATDAMWVYQADTIIVSPPAIAELLAFSQQHHIGDLFFATHFMADQKGSYAVARAGDLQRFLAAAEIAGVRVHALTGDPTDVLPENHSKVLGRVDAVVAFNEAAPHHARFSGIHFDIEPHALPKWKTSDDAEKTELLTRFVEVHAKAAELLHARASRLIYGADVVFWLHKSAPDGSPLYPVTFRGITQNPEQHLLSLVDQLALMSYRSFAQGKNGIIELVRQSVQQADGSHARVYVGIKMADIGPPLETFYGRSEEEMQRAVSAVNSEFHSHRGYAGVAYFMYGAYRTMPAK
jgi:hypothetical protein